MVLTSTVRVHNRATGNQPGPVRGADRVYREADAHVWRERVSDHLPATEVHNRGQIQPTLTSRETADVTDQLQAGHRRGELPPNKIRNRSGARIRPGQVAASTPGDSGDAVFPHQPGHDAPPHRDAATLQLTRDAKHAVGRMRRVYLEDQRGQPPLIMLSVTALAETADPGTVIGAIGKQDPTQQLGAEPVTPLVDEREALPRWRMVHQRLGRFAQDLVLAAQVPALAPAAAQLLTRLRERSHKIITDWSTRRDLARLRNFYRRVGLSQIIDEDDFAAFDLRGVVLALFPIAELARDGRAEPDSAGIGFSIGIMVDTPEDVDRLTAGCVTPART